VQGELERLLERREQMGVQIRELGDENVRLDKKFGRPPSGCPPSSVSVRSAPGARDAEQLAADRSRASAESKSAVERQRAALALERDHAGRRCASNQTRLAAERIDLMRSAGDYGSARLSWGDAPSGSRPSSPRPGRRADRLVFGATVADRRA